MQRDGGQGVARYQWDGQNVHLKLDNSNALVDNYQYEPSEYGKLISSSTHWHHYDPLGSTAILTTSGGAVSDAYFYSVWGDPDLPGQLTTAVDPFLFVGRLGYYCDDEGMDKNTTSPPLPNYVRGRFYNVIWGRWMNPDPLGIEALPNLYGYVNNNPVNAVDPSGRYTIRKKYCRGNDDPDEPPYTTAIIEANVVVDTRSCGLLGSILLCESGGQVCTGSAPVTLYYKATSATTAQNEKLFGQGQDCNIGGNKLKLEGEGGAGDTLSVSVSLGSVSCKGGSVSGKLSVMCQPTDPVTGKKVGQPYPSQRINYMVTIKECGQQGDSYLYIENITQPGKLPNPLVPCPKGSKDKL